MSQHLDFPMAITVLASLLTDPEAVKGQISAIVRANARNGVQFGPHQASTGAL